MEEEYLLLDATDGRPVDIASVVIGELSAHAGPAEREFFSSQLETATPICVDAIEAEAQLRRFRSEAGRIAAAHGALLAGTGLPPVGGETVGTVTRHDRYRQIDADMRGAGAYQYVTGTHIHVEVPSRDAGVAVLRRLSRWAPVLLAMTANSPVWCGEATGFASWRTLMGTNWPLTGYPPDFADGEEYAHTVEQLVSSGVLRDPGIVTWLARLSDNYPTVELRIADAQLSPADSVSFAVLVRALVERALHDEEHGLAAPPIAPGLVDGAIWVAARNGLESDLVDPVRAAARPAFDVVDEMLGTIRPELVRFGDFARVKRYVELLRREGSPARRQIRRFSERGIPGLLDLYRTAAAPPNPSTM
ncbi:MAG: YbdK family carboxylate-amine ligase [Leucobacter sp.]